MMVFYNLSVVHGIFMFRCYNYEHIMVGLEKYQIDGYLWDDKGVMLINGVIGMIIP
jgi:hypothetical protein